MGRKRNTGSQRIETLPLQTDAEGNIRYDMILRQRGGPENRIVHAQLKDLTEKDIKEDDESLARPDEETVKAATEKTRLALEKLVDGQGLMFVQMLSLATDILPPIRSDQSSPT